MAAFFLLAFAFTWALQWPGLLAQHGALPGPVQVYMPFAALGIFGPLVAASLLSFREGGWDALKQLFRPLMVWKLPLGWSLLALLVPGVLLAGVLALLNLSGRLGSVTFTPSLGGLVLAVVISIAEEIGWRGYALPRLQQRWGAFAAGTTIGIVWYLWHLPMFIGLGVPLNLVLVMLLYFVGASLLLTRLYNTGRAGLWLAVLGHLGAHLNNSHRALPDEVAPLVVHAIVYAGLGLLLMRGSLDGKAGRGRELKRDSPRVRRSADRRPVLRGTPAARPWCRC